MVLILSGLFFLAVALAAAGLFYWLTPSRAEQRLEAISVLPSSPGWTAIAVKVAGPFAKLSLPEGEWERSPLRVRFLNAGIRHPDARIAYFSAKTLLPLLLAGITFPIMRAASIYGVNLLFCVLLAALVGCYLPNLVLGWVSRVRRREILESFPDAADLMLVCVEAGLGLDAALTKVGDEIRRRSTALAEELHLTNLEMRAGASREQALRNLALRSGVEEIGIFSTMLTQADKFGTSIGDSLRVFSDELRHKRQVRAEESAAKIPVKLLFPLVLFIFPSIMMVVLGPAIIQVVRTLAPMLSGR